MKMNIWSIIYLEESLGPEIMPKIIDFQWILKTSLFLGMFKVSTSEVYYRAINGLRVNPMVISSKLDFIPTNSSKKFNNRFCRLR